MTKELDQDTKEALAEQTQDGITEPDRSTEPTDASEELPDITLKDTEQTTEDTTNTEDNPEEISEEDSVALKTLEDAGYSEDDVIKRIKDDGGLSPEFLDELKQKIDPVFVDAHVRRIQAEAELQALKEVADTEALKAKNEATAQMNTYIYDLVGGADKFSAMGKALKSELMQDELSAINAKLASGNKTVVREGLEAAVQKYNKIRGMGGKLMEGDAGNSTDPVIHITKEEYRRLMSTEKYKTDPQYAAKIDADRLRTRKLDAERYGNGAYFGYHPSKGRYAL